jgi:hypothetical protein
MPKREPLYWNNELVGFIENPMPDMYYLEGRWIPLNNEAATSFREVTSEKDFLFTGKELREDELIWIGLGENKPTHLFMRFFEDHIVLRIVISLNRPENW